jgi:tetratricopeptide (TPR) repeat protein
LGNALIETSNFEEAEEKINRGLEAYRKKLPADHWNISYAESMLGKCFLKEGKYEQAEKILLQAYNNLLDKRGKEDRMTITALKRLIKNYELWGKSNQADIYREKLNPISVNTEDVTEQY